MLLISGSQTESCPLDLSSVSRNSRQARRVGRSTAAKALDEDAVRLAVVAHIRHTETPYDGLLVGGVERSEARACVRDQVATVLSDWQH